MKVATGAIVVAFGVLLVASGQARAQQCGSIPCELSVSASPERQEVLWPFSARIRVTVTDNATGLPVRDAKIVAVARYRRYSPALSCAVIQSALIDRFMKTNSRGTASFQVKTGSQWLGVGGQPCP